MTIIGDSPYASEADLASVRRRRPVTGAVIAGPAAPPRPQRVPLMGRYGGVEPLDPGRHGDGLFMAGHADGGAERIWTYKAIGPFATAEAMNAWLAACAASDDPQFVAIVEAASRRPVGMAAFLNIRPEHGVAELGHIWFGAAWQRSRVTAEALIVLMRHAFDDCGYRRLEWKCDARNQASRTAALRLGFRFEGVFLNHMVVKGRNRDTAWYSLIDSEWPPVHAQAERWLDPANFDPTGRQRTALSALNHALW